MQSHRQLSLPLLPVALRRVVPMQNMRRFYSLDVERDLFGRVVLVRRWGRIGTAGRVRLDEYAGEGEALAAMQALQERKVRRGYRAIRLPCCGQGSSHS
jgi:predicted DNA-binding WGR domain protein